MFVRSAVSSLLFLTVAACSGGSGGGSSSSGTSFSGFSELPEDGVTVIEGQAVTADYTADLSSGDVEVEGSPSTNSSSAKVTTANGSASALGLTTQGQTVTLDQVSDQGDIIGFTNDDETSAAFFANPDESGFEHQTFGTWLTGYGTGSGTVGAGSYGTKTKASSIPANATASYSGVGLGVARLADGQPHLTASKVDVSTDFDTVTISSEDTLAVSVNTGASTDASELDFTGTGDVSGSGFSVSVSGSGTSGSAQGQFYGASAEEVGGTFETSGSGGISHIGAFGGN